MAASLHEKRFSLTPLTDLSVTPSSLILLKYLIWIFSAFISVPKYFDDS